VPRDIYYKSMKGILVQIFRIRILWRSNDNKNRSICCACDILGTFTIQL